jgi:hypothetical protein
MTVVLAGTNPCRQWQVIFIGDPNMVENLRNHQRYHEHTQQRALIGGSLPPVPDCRDLGPDGCNEDQPPAGLGEVSEAEAAYRDGDFVQASAVSAGGNE